MKKVERVIELAIWAAVIVAALVFVGMCVYQASHAPVPTIEQQQADECHWATVEYNKNPTQANWEREVQKCDKP